MATETELKQEVVEETIPQTQVSFLGSFIEDLQAPLAANTVYNKDGFTATNVLFGIQGSTAGNYGAFFVVPVKCEVIRIDEVHEVKGSDGSAVELDIERLRGTENTAQGDLLLTTPFNLKATEATVYNGTLTATKSFRVLEVGNRIGFRLNCTPTAVRGVVVTVYLVPLGQGHYRKV